VDAALVSFHGLVDAVVVNNERGRMNDINQRLQVAHDALKWHLSRGP
jgi:hypothetical protein